MSEKMRSKRALIFLIFGASGSGKSTLIREIESMGSAVSIHVKGTDRPSRQYDGDEIHCKPEVSPDEYDYIYTQYTHKYGIQKKQIDQAIKANIHHFIICNDVDTISALRQDYRERVRVVFLSFDAPRDILLAIQQSRGISDDEIELRIQKIRVLNQTFVDRNELFDAAILNRFGDSPKQMLDQLRRIIESEERAGASRSEQRDGHSPRSRKEAEEEAVFLGIAGIASVVKEIEAKLTSHAERLAGGVQDDYVFILMAMQSDDPLLEDVHAAMKRASEKLGLRAERVDDIVHTDQITDKILGSIRCAEYIIADLTHERPNVYYELGYAHACGKKTILTAREGTSLHFDVQNYPVITYPSAVRLEQDLLAMLSRFEKTKPSD